jgi:hypothetical protein
VPEFEVLPPGKGPGGKGLVRAPRAGPFEILAPPPSPPPGEIGPYEVLPAAPPAAPEAFEVLEAEAAPRPPGTRAARAPQPPAALPPSSYVERIFDLPRLWNEIRSLRLDPDWIQAVRESEWTGRPAEATLLVVAPRERGSREAAARFLEIPEGVLREAVRSGADPWRELLSPAFWEVERALVRLMPDDLPGDLAFAVDDLGRFGLLYREESPAV